MFQKLHLTFLRGLAVISAICLAAHLQAQPADVEAPKADPAKPAETVPPSDTAIPAPPTPATDDNAVVPAPPAPEDPTTPAPKPGKRTKNRKASKFLGVSKEEVNVTGTDYTLPAGQEVRTVTVTKGSATIEGDVRHDVVVIGGDLTISGRVGGDVVTIGGKLKLNPTAKVDGSAVTLGGELERDPGAQITGEVVELGPRALGEIGRFIHNGQLPLGWKSWVAHCLQLGRPMSFEAAWTVAIDVVFLVFYILLVLLFPGAVQACRNAIAERALNTIILGIAGIPLIACAMLLLLVTAVGILAWPFLIAASIVASYIGKAALLVTFGTTLARPFRGERKTPVIIALVLGWLVVSALYLVPFLAFIVWFSLALWGLGIALSAISRSTKRPAKPGTAGPRPANPPPTPKGATNPGPSPSEPKPEFIASLAPPLPVMAMAMAGNATGPTLSTETQAAVLPGTSTIEEPMIAPPEPPPLASEPSKNVDPPPAPKSTRTESAAPLAASQKRPRPLIRFGALALDCLVLSGVVRLANIESTLLQLLIIIAYQWAMLYWRAATIGGVLCRLKVVRIDGKPITVSVAGVRAVASILSLMSCGLGWFWAQWDHEKQTWHDKLAGTVVVELERSEPLV